MVSGKELLKWLILKTITPRLQQKLRCLYLARRVVSKQGYREPEIEVLENLVRAGSAVADIGANAGVYTFEFSSLVGPDGRVYAFEPISENFEILQAVISKAHLSNVTSFGAALGSIPSQREMVIPALLGFTG